MAGSVFRRESLTIFTLFKRVRLGKKVRDVIIITLKRYEIGFSNRDIVTSTMGRRLTSAATAPKALVRFVGMPWLYPAKSWLVTKSTSCFEDGWSKEIVQAWSKSYT
jgi:hypothetical protein